MHCRGRAKRCVFKAELNVDHRSGRSQGTSITDQGDHPNTDLTKIVSLNCCDLIGRGAIFDEIRRAYRRAARSRASYPRSAGNIDSGLRHNNGYYAHLMVLDEIPRGLPVRRDWRERRRKAGRVREQTAQFVRRILSGCGLSGGRRPLAPRIHPSIRRRS